MGVAFAINSDLGVSPVNSLPFIVSHIVDIDMGICVAVMFVVFILIQIAILRNDFKWINLTQILFAFIFGYFVDLTRLILGSFQIPTYTGQLLMLCISIVLIACGIILFMEARLVNLPPEGLMAAITQKIPKLAFNKVKIAVDLALVVTAILLAFIFFGELSGVREGTVIAAIMVGKVMPYVRKVISPILNKVIPNSTPEKKTS
jgi:uncharacterized membrane protein YczE